MSNFAEKVDSLSFEDLPPYISLIRHLDNCLQIYKNINTESIIREDIYKSMALFNSDLNIKGKVINLKQEDKSSKGLTFYLKDNQDEANRTSYISEIKSKANTVNRELKTFGWKKTPVRIKIKGQEGVSE